MDGQGNVVDDGPDSTGVQYATGSYRGMAGVSCTGFDQWAGYNSEIRTLLGKCPGIRGVLHGDRRCSAIAAASIVAKVTRDRQMLDLHSRDPRYGFDRHKGYATADHLDAVARFGYSEVHRRSFRPPTLFDTID